MNKQDVLFNQTEYWQWEALLAPKIAGTRNLHEIPPTDMDFSLSFRPLPESSVSRPK